MTKLLDNAITYSNRGFSVIPVRGKKPCVKWTPFQTQRPSNIDVQRMFSDGNPTGIAIICGEVSGGLVVRDFDDEESYLAWQRSHQELAETLPTVKTARGYHIYFANCHRKITYCKSGELRGAGYVIAPPSQLANGFNYEWINPLPDGPIPEIDPFGVGLAADRENREYRENRENGEKNHSTACALSVLSALSVNSPEIELAIKKTQPQASGQRNRGLFAFVRELKAIPALKHANIKELQPFVIEWCRQAQPVMSGEHDVDDSLAQFAYGWERVKFPVGKGPFDIAIQRIEESTVPTVAKQFTSQGTRQLIHLCYELQCIHGDSPFFLSCRMAGEVAHMDKTTAWKRLGLLMSYGIIEMVQPGTKRNAARYRYIPPVEGEDND